LPPVFVTSSLSFKIVRITIRAKRSALMSQEKYIGMYVHQATLSVAVVDASGKLIMECLL
jgi:hypothetical protein